MDIIEQINKAAGLSKNSGVQITAYDDGRTTVHFIMDNGHVKFTEAPNVPDALTAAINYMEGQFVELKHG